MTPDRELFLRPTVEVARLLLGALIIRDLPEGRLAGASWRRKPTCTMIRPATPCANCRTAASCHRQTARNASMFGPPGRAYVYFTYGNHYMLNVVTQPEGMPDAVLIRALEPLEGVEIMLACAAWTIRALLTNGPGKLTQALGIDRTLDGHDLTQPPLQPAPRRSRCPTTGSSPPPASASPAPPTAPGASTKPGMRGCRGDRW